MSEKRVPAADLRDLAIPIPRQALNAGAWWDTGWRALPSERARSTRSRVTAFNVQAALTAQEPAPEYHRVVEALGGHGELVTARS